MNRHASASTLRPAVAATLAVLTAACVGFGAGIPLGLAALTGDWHTTGQTLLIAIVVVAAAADLVWMTRTAAALHNTYRRRP